MLQNMLQNLPPLMAMNATFGGILETAAMVHSANISTYLTKKELMDTTLKVAMLHNQITTVLATEVFIWSKCQMHT